MLGRSEAYSSFIGILNFIYFQVSKNMMKGNLDNLIYIIVFAVSFEPTSYTRPPTGPRRASGALGALQGREGNDPPSPPAPQAYRAGVLGALGPAGPGHGGSCGPPVWRRKRPRTPRHLGAFRGPSGGPRWLFLWPRRSWEPAALEALRGRRGNNMFRRHRRPLSPRN